MKYIRKIKRELKLHNKEIGKYGEELAVKYLENLGYNIICRNFITSTAELDIIANNIDEYIFIEVKTRVSKRYGDGIEAINENKKRHIINAAKYFIYRNNLENKNIRFDVIEVYINSKYEFVNHVKGVFFLSIGIINE